MSIFRAETTQLSVAGEAAPGGHLEVATGTDSGTGGSTLNGATTAGARSIVANDATGYAADNYIQVDVTNLAECRRITRVSSNTIYLDLPLSFDHANGATLNEVAAPFTVTSYLTFLPGVYETVSTPDLTPEIVPHYFLGTASERNFFTAYRGRQAFNGALPNFLLLNGIPLRFPIGTVATTGTDSGTGGSTMSAASNKGDRAIAVTDGTGYANNDFVQIGTGTTAEVRQIVSGASGAGAQTFVLNHPTMFDHANATALNEVTSPYTHTISESFTLDTISMNLQMRDSGETTANDLVRRWVGGIVGRAEISASEGEMVRMSWDMMFLDHTHNQRFHSSIGGGATEIVKYNGALGSPVVNNGALPNGTASYPTTEPYYFSQGSISFFGVTFARIRNFRIDISNNPVPYYYITDLATSRSPSEIIEQRREYRMSATVALPDSFAAATATTRSLFKELLLEGNYGSGMAGFDVSLTFTRGASDTITITIPPTTAAVGGDSQGAYILRASHDIGTDSPVSVSLDMLFRSLSIVCVDSLATYC